MDEVNQLYQKRSYMDRYGIQLWISIIICILFLLTIGYYYTTNNLKSLQKDWSDNRCNPIMLPFAGMIQKEDGLTAEEYTQKNFEYCLNKSAQPLTRMSYKPFKAIAQTLASDFRDFGSSMSGININLNQKEKTKENSESSLVDSTTNTINSSYITLKKLTSLTQKMNGATYLLSQQLQGTLYTTMSVMNRLFQVVLKIQKALGINIIKDKCFAKGTLIQLANGEKIPIEDVVSNDVLHDGSTVTSTMVLSSKDAIFYELDEVLVTHNHNVFHPVGGWIPVSKHPDSTLVKHTYPHEHLYCLNTTSKTIRINGYIFSDWDDLDDNDLEKLRRYFPSVARHNVHVIFENGFPGDTELTLQNGTVAQMKDLKPGDFLYSGEKIEGIVRMISLGLPNYHLITDTSTFMLNHDVLGDYNTLIEKYL